MLNQNQQHTLTRWHEFVVNRNEQILPEILADEMQFFSPFVYKPKNKAAAMTILQTVTNVFEDFRYTRKMFGASCATLEFAANVGAISLQGVDIIEFDEAGKIIEFKVMIRPANGLQALGAAMNERLTAQGVTV